MMEGAINNAFQNIKKFVFANFQHAITIKKLRSIYLLRLNLLGLQLKSL